MLTQLALHASEPSKPLFADVTAEAGITWKHFNGFSPDRYLIEAMGGGVAWLDFDGDGLLDIFLLNGGETPRGKSEKPLRNALYRNLGNGKFEDVAEASGLHLVKNYGMGVAAADFDNDGHQDLYVTGYPTSILYHNNGDGTFTDVTADAGVANAGRWASSAAWFDYDRDGFLDLIVCNYVEFSFEGTAPRCEYANHRTYCEQRAYTGMPLTLYRNNRNGTFTDVSKESGLDKFVGRALGVVAMDLDNDGWSDLFITRDASPNLLLMNKRDGKFVDAGFEAEVALDSNGDAKSGMGVEAADINGDTLPDLLVTNFNYEFHSLLLGRNTFPFEDHTRSSHLAEITRPYVGWGIHTLDYDNDGLLDLMIVNGHVIEGIEASLGQVTYKERPLLLHNNGNAVFEDLTASAGPAFSKSYLARGLAIADWNNDGWPDAIFTSTGDQPVLLRNDNARGHAWIGVQLIGAKGKSNRDAIGSKVTLHRADRRMVRWITGGSSYLSSHDKRLLFGLGDMPAGSTVDVEILWPSGAIQAVHALPVNHYHHIEEPSEVKKS